ncbi:MAG: tetratricopeptide repeat protein [Deltaproteobacteria bacterium]|nr:tetratricopeptide repeat protein [Deltaproteobacteria bacterium]
MMNKSVSAYNSCGGGLRVFGAALIASALILSGCSRGEKAAESPSPSATVVDEGKAHFDKGVQLSMKGQYDEAIKEYEETIKLNPKSAQAYNNLGFAYMDKGDVERAIESQKKAVELNASLANAYYGLALALEKKGDKKEALKNWKEFMKMSEPHGKWWLKAQEHVKALEKK